MADSSVAVKEINHPNGDDSNEVSIPSLLYKMAKGVLVYDQTTNTVLYSKGVSSVVDNSTGYFTVDTTDSYDNVNVPALVAVSPLATGGSNRAATITPVTSSSFDIYTTVTNTAALVDCPYVVVVFLEV